jgi:hypothetical protein
MVSAGINGVVHEAGRLHDHRFGAERDQVAAINGYPSLVRCA